jgi:hypothetical protein
MWFSSKLLFFYDRPLARARRPGEFAYEERIILLDVPDSDAAFDRVEVIGNAYAERLACHWINTPNWYQLCDELRQLAEVYSLMRASTLPPYAYMSHFFGEPAVRVQAYYPPDQWFGIKMIYEFEGRGRIPGERLYEERVVLARGGLLDVVMEEIRQESSEYANSNESRALEFMDVYPIGLAESWRELLVYNNIRLSELPHEDFVREYYETGSERISEEN